MKSICVIALASLFFFAGAFSQKKLDTQQAQNNVKGEITEAVELIFSRLETLNVDTLFEGYLNSSSFVLFTTDGSMANYEAAQKHHQGWFLQLSGLKVSTKKEEIRVLSNDVAVCAWRGTFDMTFKSGGHSQADFGITFLLVRRDNYWKVAYQQTAPLPSDQQSKPK